jgi:hypothetical protein
MITSLVYAFPSTTILPKSYELIISYIFVFLLNEYKIKIRDWPLNE